MYHDTHRAVSLASRFTGAFVIMLAIALLVPWPLGHPDGQVRSLLPFRLSAPVQSSPTPSQQPKSVRPTVTPPVRTAPTPYP